MKRFVRDNSMTLFFGLLCVLTILGDAAVGVRVFNQEALEHDEPTLSLWRYVFSAQFGEAMSENWQSEFLQFTTFILAAVWLYQRGSVESKTRDDLGLMSDKDEKIGRHAERNSPRLAKLGDWRTTLYSHSLVIVMTFLFLFSWLAQALTGWRMFNNEQLEHHEATVRFFKYLTLPDFWEPTLQNWQSEFMALATMAIFSVYLRERGSPESHAVGDPHGATSRSN